jgi:mRNA interferase RelE/StbE
MSYTVVIPKGVKKMIDELPEYIQSRLIETLDQLGKHPRPVGAKKLRGKDGWRIRIGNFRVVTSSLKRTRSSF